MEQLTESPQGGFLRANQIAGPGGLLPIGRSTWWKWVKEGRAPQPIKLGPMTTVWRSKDIRELIERLSEPEAAA